MASPAILAGIGIGGSALGGILGAYGAKQSAEAQSQTYMYQAGIAEYNKKIALQNRDYAYAAGEKEAVRYGFRARQQLGSITAGLGASGFKVDTGSAADVARSQRDVALIDQATIRDNAARVAYGYATQAEGQGLQAGLYTKAAADTRKAGKINMLSSLLSGATSVSSKWLQGNQVGIF